MKMLKELIGDRDDSLELDGFKLYQEEDVEEDNIKISHIVRSPDKRANERGVMLDHSPYERIDKKTFKKYIDYYHKYGRFPTRSDLATLAPLTSRILQNI